jgi:hypothetical protein
LTAASGFVDKITAYFQSEVSVELRIDYFQEQLYELFILTSANSQSWVYQAIFTTQVSVEYGSFYQLIFAFSKPHGVIPLTHLSL